MDMNKYDLTQEELDYLVEFMENDNLNDWGKPKSDLNSELHKDTIRKAFGVSKFCGYSVYRFMQKKIEDGFLSDEEAIRLEKLRDKEYKERVKLQDANRERRKVLRDFSRVEAIQEYIEKKLDEREPVSFEPFNYEIKNGREASALISDLHAGATVDSIFNFYDLDTLRERMEQLSNKIIYFCKRDNVEILHTEFLGDFITGIIHGSTIAQANEDVIDQVLDASDIIVEFIKSLRKELPCVKTYFIYGNHGRTSQGKADRANKENFERLISSIVRKDLRNTDISVIDGGYEDFLTYKLKDGKLIVATHGTNDNPNNANKTFTKLLGTDVYEVHMGHLHDYKESNGTTVNGSVMGGDDYSISHRFGYKSIQVMKIYYDDEDIITCKFKLD